MIDNVPEWDYDSRRQALCGLWTPAISYVKCRLRDREPPKVPELFLKAITSLIGTDDDIVIPRETVEQGVKMQPEAKPAVVIGKRCKRPSKSDASSYVLGYTCEGIGGPTQSSEG